MRESWEHAWTILLMQAEAQQVLQQAQKDKELVETGLKLKKTLNFVLFFN